MEKTINRENLLYKTNEHTCVYKNFWTIKTFDIDIYNSFKEADEDQKNLLVEILNFRKEIKNKSPAKKNDRKKIFLKHKCNCWW